MENVALYITVVEVIYISQELRFYQSIFVVLLETGLCYRHAKSYEKSKAVYLKAAESHRQCKAYPNTCLCLLRS